MGEGALTTIIMPTYYREGRSQRKASAGMHRFAAPLHACFHFWKQGEITGRL